MPRPKHTDDSVMISDEIRAALSQVNETPMSFVDTVIGATLMDDFTSLCKLIDSLEALRAHHARNTSNQKLWNKPSPVEVEYQLSLVKLIQSREAKRRHRATIMGQVIMDSRQTNTLRFNALTHLLASDDRGWLAPLDERSKAFVPLRTFRSGEFEPTIFQICLNAMSEEFLAAEDQNRAQHMARQMFRNCEPGDFGIEVEVHRSRYETDTEEGVFERLFDQLYGDGTYAELTSGGGWGALPVGHL